MQAEELMQTIKKGTGMMGGLKEPAAIKVRKLAVVLFVFWW